LRARGWRYLSAPLLRLDVRHHQLPFEPVNLTSDHALIVPVVRRPEYTIGLEQPNPDCTFAHCSIHVPWTGRVRRQITDDWTELKSASTAGRLYALIPPHDTKLQKWAELFGFQRELVLTDLTTGRAT
jgi:hypothetical protein